MNVEENLEKDKVYFKLGKIMERKNKKKQILNVSKKRVSTGRSSEKKSLKTVLRQTKLKSTYKVFYARPPVPPKE